MYEATLATRVLRLKAKRAEDVKPNWVLDY